MSITLSKICDELKYIKDQLAQGEGIDIEKIDALEIAYDKKSESLGYVMLYIKYLIDEAKSEIKRITEYKKYLENELDRCKNYAIYCLNRKGDKSFKGKNVGYYCRKSPMSAKYIKHKETGKPLWDFIDPDFVYEVSEKKVDVEGAKRQYKDTKEPIAGFEFIEDKETLVIK